MPITPAEKAIRKNIKSLPNAKKRPSNRVVQREIREVKEFLAREDKPREEE